MHESWDRWGETWTAFLSDEIHERVYSPRGIQRYLVVLEEELGYSLLVFGGHRCVRVRDDGVTSQRKQLSPPGCGLIRPCRRASLSCRVKKASTQNARQWLDKGRACLGSSVDSAVGFHYHPKQAATRGITLLYINSGVSTEFAPFINLWP